MIKTLTESELLTTVQGEVIQRGKSTAIEHIITDSRKIIFPETTLFIPLSGLQYDGHHFLTSAYDSGVRHFIVNKNYLPASALPEATLFAVQDTLEALQQIARWNRSLFGGPVVGITGSNGKTIVKEWLGQVIGRVHSVVKSPKSYNSQIGVPLSVLEIHDYHKVAILEAGISTTGEMEKLEKIIQPAIGLFTNLGTAHEEGFSSRLQKLKEKIKLFANSHYIIYRKDQQEVSHALEDTFPAEKLISWSVHPGADYTLSSKKASDHTRLTLIQPDLSVYTFRTAFTDEASLENLGHVIIASLSLGISPAEITDGIKELKPVDMRLTLKQGIHNSTLIDDTYNNDLAGLGIALEFLQNQRRKRKKILILSDLLQAGESEKVYEQVQKLVLHYGIDFLYGVGPEIKKLEVHFPGQSAFYPDTPALIQALHAADIANDLILVKGARSFQFEQVVNFLQQRIHGTTLEINLNALSHNYNFYKRRLSPTTKIMAMVKAFAYGGGALEIANHLQQLKADYLAVAYTDEGIYLRNQGIHLPIMVLNPDREGFKNLLKYRLDPVVFSLEFFQQLGKFCQQENEKINIHLDFDTGMRRLGFEPDEMDKLAHLIHLFPELNVASIYTHLAGADEAQHKRFTLEQLEMFQKIGQQVQSLLGYPFLMHALNSAGIVRYPEFQFDMVRLGIGLYGIEVNNLFAQDLRTISTLKTSISQIKTLPKGQSVGYGRKGEMKEDGKIATIPLGYADGYDRRFSNGKGYVLIHGKKAPVIGNVCMDMCMVNITDIDCKVGDEAIVYGEKPSVIELAQAIGTIPYELLTNISNRVKRVYYLD